jgi:hypothetical protein
MCKICGRRINQDAVNVCGWCDKIQAEVMSDLRAEVCGQE